MKHLFDNHGFKLITKGRPAKKVSVEHGISLFKQSTPDFFLKEKTINFLGQNIGKYSLPFPPTDLKWYLFKKINY